MLPLSQGVDDCCPRLCACRKMFTLYPPVYVQVLEDVTEIEMTPEGKKLTKLDQILLNGNNIALLVPGGKPDDME